MKALFSTDGQSFAVIPDSAAVSRANPWFMPEDGTPGQWNATVCVAAIISRLGMNIAQRFAHRYYSQLCWCAVTDNPGIEPWTRFVRDGALVVGTGTIDAADSRADAWRAEIDRRIEAASRYMTLKTGDMILVPVDTVAGLSEGSDYCFPNDEETLLTLKVR